MVWMFWASSAPSVAMAFKFAIALDIQSLRQALKPCQSVVMQGSFLE